MTSAAFPRLLQPRAVYNEIRAGYKSVPEIYSKIFSEETTNQAQVTDMNIVALGPYAEWGAENDEMFVDRGYEGYEWTYRPKYYGLQFAITYYLQKTQQYNIVQALARALGRSARFTIEQLAHGVFNLGDTVVGGDGVPLFSDNHPLLSGTDSNIVPGDLSVDTLYEAFLRFDTRTDDRGIPIYIQPKILLVPKYLMRVVHEILKSEKLPHAGVDNINTANYFYGQDITVISSPYLTDNNDWFLIADKDTNALKAFWLEKPKVDHYVDNATKSVVYQGWFAVAFGWSDWRGVVMGRAT